MNNMYQLMLFEDMLPEHVSYHSKNNTESPKQFHVCSVNGEQLQFTIQVNEEQDPETIALEALGYFVVPELSIPYE